MNKNPIKLFIAAVSMAAVIANGSLIIQDSFNYNLGGSSDEDSGLNGGSGLPASSTATAACARKNRLATVCTVSPFPVPAGAVRFIL